MFPVLKSTNGVETKRRGLALPGGAGCSRESRSEQPPAARGDVAPGGAAAARPPRGAKGYGAAP